jgi:hypothetical protein
MNQYSIVHVLRGFIPGYKISTFHFLLTLSRTTLTVVDAVGLRVPTMQLQRQ